MKKSTVDPACTGLFSPLFLDYLDRKEATTALYNVFPTLENFETLIEQRRFDENKRQVLVDVLAAQYQGIETKAAVDKNIRLLSQDNTYTVTTGHQLNLMTGPLYFIYKIVSTINLAKQLRTRYPAVNIVPIFWMASEDHDFEEINHFVFDGKKYTWETDQKGAVGAFLLDKGFKDLLAQMPFVPDFLREAYTSSACLAEAVRRYVHYLFGDEGLVVVDGNNVQLKSLFAPIIKDDLLHQHANALVQQQSEKIEKLGYKLQISPREVNFFYCNKGLRERILVHEETYRVINSDIIWTKESLLKELDQHPERFSPNVVMRPLYQEYILPNIAYLGGPAEVVYWFQLTPVFAFYQVDYPSVMPRNFSLILPKAVAMKVNKLGLSEGDLFKPFDDLRISYATSNAAQDISLASERERLEELMGLIATKAERYEPSLVYATNAAKVRGLKILEQLATKFRKAEEVKQHLAIRQLKEIKEALFPGGVPQERKINFLNFFLDDPHFIEQLLMELDPLDFKVIILTPDAH